MAVLGLIVADTQRTWFGQPNRLGRALGDRSVLQHTVERAAQVASVERIVLVHPSGQAPMDLLETGALTKPVSTFAVDGALADAYTPHLRAARKWALTAWRGGLGESPVLDELLPPGPLHAAAQHFHGHAAMVVRGEWCVFDPALAEAQLKTHLDEPEGLSITFTQAPPGLSPLVCSASVLEQLTSNQGSFGAILGYNPSKPRMDPISRDANIQVPASVRDCNRRFIADTKRGEALLDAVADRLGDALPTADASAITEAARAAEAAGDLDAFDRLPQQVTLELTPRREPRGEVVPQHYVTLAREDLSLDLATRIFDQLSAMDDVAVMLGGLGDALLHPQWEAIVAAAHAAGVLGIGIETDLRCEPATIDRLLTLPVDLVFVRLNADQPETYQRTMGDDGLAEVARNVRHFLERRRELAESGEGAVGLPWLVPSLTKTATTLSDLEAFFQRWTTTFACQPVLSPATTGCGQMPALSPVPMTPPGRQPCRQLGRRMSILADGTIALCDQDWHGQAALGDAASEALLDAWGRAAAARQAHRAGRYDDLTLCGQCREWHRP